MHNISFHNKNVVISLFNPILHQKLYIINYILYIHKEVLPNQKCNILTTSKNHLLNFIS